MSSAPTESGDVYVGSATAAQLPQVRERFREYAHGLGIDLCFQGFEQELAGLPGSYAPPRGRLLVACRAEQVVGCVALRPLSETDCEMKRLYVIPACRGLGIAERLTAALIEEARSIGYRRMLLDTLKDMTAARNLYARLGFREIPAYYHNPIPGAIYLAKPLFD